MREMREKRGDGPALPRGATRACGICSGTLHRGEIASMAWRSKRRTCVIWRCDNCGTEGSVLRDSDGSVLRFPHVVTGRGFEIVGEDTITVDLDKWALD